MKTNSPLLINEPPLQVLPSLVLAIGFHEALILQQIQYWITNPRVGVERNGYRWVYNTYEEWHENFPFWCISTIKHTFRRLEKSGIVVSEQFDKHNWDHKKYYRIDYGRLEEVLEERMTQKIEDMGDDGDNDNDDESEVNNEEVNDTPSCEFSDYPSDRSRLTPLRSSETTESETTHRLTRASAQTEQIEDMPTYLPDDEIQEDYSLSEEIQEVQEITPIILEKNNSTIPSESPEIYADIIERAKKNTSGVVRQPRTKEEMMASTRAAVGKFYARQSAKNPAIIAADLSGFPEETVNLAEKFAELFGRGPTKSEKGDWIRAIREQISMGLNPKDIELAYQKHRRDGLTVRAPASLTSVAWDLKRVAQEKASPRSSFPVGASEIWSGGVKIQ